MTEQEMQTQGFMYPKEFFDNNRPPIKEGLCFVLMPFEAEMDEVYEQAIAEAVSECGLTPVRADEIFDTRPIMVSIMEKIAEAEVVVADVTRRNPNVFYELGMTHVLKDKVILLTQDIGDIPFDLRHLRFIHYEDSVEGALELRQRLIETLGTIGLKRESSELAALAESDSDGVETVESAAKPLSTTIYFDSDEKFDELKGRMFAILVDWVEFEDIKDERLTLIFPGGVFRKRGDGTALTLVPGPLPISELIQGFADRYASIEFRLETQFDIGDLVRRSRNSDRVIVSLSSNKLTLSLERAKLIIRNTGEGGSITVDPDSYRGFSTRSELIPFALIPDYLERDPPTDKLDTLIKDSLD